jgi:hypothetical protein
MAEASVLCLFPTKVGPVISDQPVVVTNSCVLDTSSILSAVTIPNSPGFTPSAIDESMIQGIWLFGYDLENNTRHYITQYLVVDDFELGDLLDFNADIVSSGFLSFGFSVYVYDGTTTYLVELEACCALSCDSANSVEFTPGLFQLESTNSEHDYFAYVTNGDKTLDTAGYLTASASQPWSIVVTLENIMDTIVSYP